MQRVGDAVTHLRMLQIERLAGGERHQPMRYVRAVQSLSVAINRAVEIIDDAMVH